MEQLFSVTWSHASLEIGHSLGIDALSLARGQRLPAAASPDDHICRQIDQALEAIRPLIRGLSFDVMARDRDRHETPLRLLVLHRAASGIYPVKVALNPE